MKSIVIYLFLLALNFSTSLSQTWTSLNSPAGFKNVRAMSIDSTGNTIYACDETNVLNSTDNGQTWSGVSSQQSSTIAVTTKYNNSQIVLVSGSTFMRSTNGGAAWSELLSTTTNKPTALADFPQNSGTMLLGRKYGSSSVLAIARSTDNGATWADQLSTSYKPRIYDITTNVSTAYPERAIAAGGPDGSTATGTGLFYTSTYGDIWAARMNSAGNPSWTAVAFAYNLGTVNDVWAGTADGKLYKGTWAATSMTQQTAFPPGHTFQDTVRKISIDPGNYSIVYVGTDRSVYKTTNGGTSWTCLYASSMTDSRSYSLVMHPLNSSKIVLGTRGYIYRTTDGGGSWNSSSSTTTRSIPLISIAPSGTTAWSISNEITVGMNYDGSAWNTYRLGNKDSTFLGNAAVTYKNGSTRYLYQTGSQDDHSMVYLSKDNGVTFYMDNTFKTTMASTSCQGIVQDPSLDSRVFAFGKLDASGNPRNVFLSTNHGDSWSAVAGLVTTNKWLTVAPLGDGLLAGGGGASKWVYAGAFNAGLWQSSDGGGTWTSVGGSTILTTDTVYSLASSMNASDTIYAAAHKGLFRVTQARSASPSFSRAWPANGNGVEVKKVILDSRFTDGIYSAAYLFWVGADNVVYRSAASGSNANSVSGDLPSGIVLNDLRVDTATSVLYIASDRGIYKTQLVARPVLIFPTDSILACSQSNPATFTWSAVTGASSYDVEVAGSTNFISLFDSTTVASNSYTYAKDTSMGLTLYWRVRSSDGTNLGKSPWTVGSFVTNSSNSPLNRPTLVSPANGVIGQSLHPVITWNGVAGAVAYKLWLSGGIFYYVYGTSIQVADLSPNHTYTWNVTPLNCYPHNADSVSTAWQFTTGSGIQGPEGPRNSHVNQTGESDSPMEFKLKQNYPNPFNPTTRFDYALPNDAHVSLKIYNTLGQVVATLVDEFQTAGWKSVQFDANVLSSGIYFYIIQAGNFRDVKKMMLIK